MTPRARERVWDLGLLFAAKGLLGAWVLSRGFSHVSDDDYSRVVIAELFAHAPRLDPSGTSWLPFPFWLTGTAMAVLGRSLATAQWVAMATGILAVAPPYVALRGVGVTRWPAVLGVVFAMASPWSAWLGVATVPEALSAGLVAAGAIAVARRERSPWFGACVFLASLSRYEAWPACAAIACASLWAARRRDLRASALFTAGLASAGPLMWIAWNLHAHGEALHFFARVAKYRQSIGAADMGLAAKLSSYPAALVRGALPVAGLAAVAALSLGDRAMRARWTAPLGVAAAILAFLVYGDLTDGAPTHHPERALLAVWWILATFAVDGSRALLVRLAWLRPRREAWVVAAAAAAIMMWIARLVPSYDEYPARFEDEHREAQVARGHELRGRNLPGFSVTPCAFEHFAVIAAFAAPERVTTAPATGSPVTAQCPIITEP